MVGTDQQYSIERQKITHIGAVELRRYRLGDRYSGARYWLQRRLIRGFIYVTMDLFLRALPQTRYESWWNLARICTYTPPSMRRWRRYAPDGFATHVTYRPDGNVFPDGLRLDPITQRFFRHSYDAVGLRTRAYLLMDLVDKYLSQRPLGDVRWVSLAAGTGVVAYDTLANYDAATQRRVQLVISEREPAFIKFARRLARSYRLRSHIDYQRGDVTVARELERLLGRQPQIVDALGLFEYLDDATAATLARRVYRRLAVGGMLVFSNMSDARPQLNVHRHAVGWPGVIVRSPEQVIAILATAGIDATAISIAEADDRVYYVYRVTRL